MPTLTRAKLTNCLRFGLMFVVLTLLLVWSVRTARADEIAVWNFNDSDLVVDHGIGTLTTNFNLTNVLFTFAGTTINARQGDSAGQSLTLQAGTSNANNGRNFTFSVNTSGRGNIVISFATQGTGTGFNSNQLQYSIDGTTFFDFGPPYSPPTSFGLLTFDLSSIAGLDNNPNAAFRIVFNGASSTSGNNRIDNLVVEGIPIPEPATLTLLGAGLLFAARKGRKRR